MGPMTSSGIPKAATGREVDSREEASKVPIEQLAAMAKGLRRRQLT